MKWSKKRSIPNPIVLNGASSLQQPSSQLSKAAGFLSFPIYLGKTRGREGSDRRETSNDTEGDRAGWALSLG